MPSLPSRIFSFVLHHRHLLEGKLKRTSSGVDRFDRQRRIVGVLSRWPVVVISAMVFGLFIGVVLPEQKRSVETAIGDGDSVDMSFFAPPDRIYQIAEDYGEEGRALYICHRLTFDVVWPLVYTLFYVSCIGFCLRYVHGDKKSITLLTSMSFLPLIFDFLENAMAVAIMALYPNRLPVVPILLTGATSIKWLIVGSVSLVWIYGVVAVLITATKRCLTKVTS